MRRALTVAGLSIFAVCATGLRYLDPALAAEDTPAGRLKLVLLSSACITVFVLGIVAFVWAFVRLFTSTVAKARQTRRSGDGGADQPARGGQATNIIVMVAAWLSAVLAHELLMRVVLA